MDRTAYKNRHINLSYTKDEGYFIYLKKGYVNDVTGSRNIHCMKAPNFSLMAEQ